MQQDVEAEWLAVRKCVQEAWQAEQAAPANGRKARVSAIVDGTGLPLRTVKRALSSATSDLAPPRVGRPCALTPADKAYLLHLCDEGLCYKDEEYVQRLQRDTGRSASLSSVQRFLTNDIVSTYRSIEYSSSDKWTEKNLLRLRIFELMMEGVDPLRVRFYDQTGFSGKDLLPKKVRKRKGGPDTPRQKRYTISSVHKHVSVFGITSIRRNLPALWTKFYSSTTQNGQGTNEHVNFFLSALAEGVLERGDIIIMDNWSGHTSAAGEALRALLKDDYGIEFIFLPAKFSELNPIEHCWRTVKEYARRSRRKLMGLRPELYMQAGCESVTHAEILLYTMSSGYGINDATKHEVMSMSDFPERATKKNKRH